MVLLTGAGRTLYAGTDLTEMAEIARAHGAGESTGSAGLVAGAGRSRWAAGTPDKL